MAYNFAADSEKLTELATILDDAAEKIKQYEEKISIQRSGLRARHTDEARQNRQ